MEVTDDQGWAETGDVVEPATQDTPTVRDYIVDLFPFSRPEAFYSGLTCPDHFFFIVRKLRSKNTCCNCPL
jgi:hypothetical protein